MTAAGPELLTIELDNGQRVSGLLSVPTGARACYVLAHGAGAGMTHPFMETVAAELAARGIATLRYQFLYMEKRSKRPDAPKVAHAAVRAAQGAPEQLLPAGTQVYLRWDGIDSHRAA